MPFRAILIVYFTLAMVTLECVGQGMGDFYEFVGKKMQYPRAASRQGIQKVIYTTFNVDSLGDIQNVVVHNDVENVFTREIVRVLKEVPANIGSLFRGKKLLLPIEFLQDGEAMDGYPREQLESIVDVTLSKMVIICYCTFKREDENFGPDVPVDKTAMLSLE